MEKDRGVKVMAIAALVLAVVGLTAGFAAFSNTLTISSSAEVDVNDTDFDVDFSTSESATVDGNVTAVLDPIAATTTTIEGNYVLKADTAVISNAARKAPKITGLKAYFTEPGQTATYSFYVYNSGKIPAYLDNVVFENVASGSTNKVCTAAEGTNTALTASACEGITIDVKVGDKLFAGSESNLTSAALEPSAALPVVVTIKYLANSTRTDGNFDVEFGDITLTYDAVA